MFSQKVKSTQICVSDCTKSWMEPVIGRNSPEPCGCSERNVQSSNVLAPEVTKSPGTPGNAAAAGHTQPSIY